MLRAVSMLALLVALSLAADPEPVAHAAARLLARTTGGEPDVRDVQRAAAEAAVQRGAGGWRPRARLAALVPRVSAELRLDERQYRVVGLTGTSEVDYLRHTPGRVLALRLTWDLPNLVFAESELRAAAQVQALAKARAEAVERATRVYYERQRLRLALAAGPPASALERAEQELRLAELAAELDAVTGGLYSGGRR